MRWLLLRFGLSDGASESRSAACSDLSCVAGVADVGRLLGYFASRESWTGDTGTTSPGPSGFQLVEVDVFRRGSQVFVDFQVTVDPPGRVLGAVAPAVLDERGALTFTFEDGWSNRGRGTFGAHGDRAVLELTITDASPLRGHVGMLYGTYQLERRTDTGRDDRHPWSVGRGRK